MTVLVQPALVGIAYILIQILILSISCAFVVWKKRKWSLTRPITFTFLVSLGLYWTLQLTIVLVRSSSISFLGLSVVFVMLNFIFVLELRHLITNTDAISCKQFMSLQYGKSFLSSISSFKAKETMEDYLTRQPAMFEDFRDNKVLYLLSSIENANTYVFLTK